MDKNKLALIKDALTLFVITLVAGFILGGVYYITKDRIAKQEELAEQSSYQSVFPTATTFVLDQHKFVLRLRWRKQHQSQQSTVEWLTANSMPEADLSQVQALNGSDILGYVVKVTSHEGYGGDISLSVGIDNSGLITGIEILSISETAGLGMNAQKESFRNQYLGKTVEFFTVTKTGATSDSEIDALSAATITSTAFTNAVNAALDFFHNYIIE